MKSIAKSEELISNEEMFDRYLTNVLDEAIEEFENDSETITFEEWKEEIRREYNVEF